MENDLQKELKVQLLSFLGKERAHASFENTVASLKEEEFNLKLPNLPYTIWGVVEHIRITQRDILNYIVAKDYQEIQWPRDYWPPTQEIATQKMFNDSLRQYKKDIDELAKLIQNPKTDLLAVTDRDTTIFNQAVLILDHTSYHTGQIITIRRVAGLWK